MFFFWDDLVQWLGMTLFEMWLHVMSLAVFLVLLVLKMEGLLFYSWWIILLPLFISDALNAYFCTVVCIRMYLEGMYKHAFVRTVWSMTVLLLLFAFKFMLCKKLTGQTNFEYSEILAPIFIFLQLLTARTCRLC